MIEWNVLPFLLSGLSLGIAAGASPGPLLALVISQTLRHGLREGLRVAVAPVVSDVPIVLLCFFVLSKVSGLGPALAWVFLLGGAFVGYLGCEALRAPDPELGEKSAGPHSLSKAVLVNLLNPHVYLFWAAVGAPMLLKGFERSNGAAVAFAGGFYTCLVGSKVLIAILVSRTRSVLRGPAYRFVMRLLGVLLLGVAAWMLTSGIAGLAAPAGFHAGPELPPPASGSGGR